MSGSVREARLVALGDVMQMSRQPVKVDRDREYPNLGIYSFGRGVFAKPPISGATTSASTLYRVREGQFIYSRLFAFEGAFGVVPSQMNGWYVSNEYPTFDVDERQAVVDFLNLAICRQPAWDELAAMTVGMGHRRQRLRPDDLLAFEIALPSLDEQRAILELCSAAEQLSTAARGEARAAFVALRARTEELLFAAEGWEVLPDGWTVGSLAEVTDIRSGITKGRKARGALRPLSFIRAANVQRGYLDLSEIKMLEVTEDEAVRFALKPGDLLLIEGGNAEHLGRGWVWGGELEHAVFQNHVFRARPKPDHVSPRYLAYAVAASPARAYCLDCAKKTTNLASINKSQISEMPIALPPRSVQEAIVEMLDSLRQTGVEAERAASAAERMQSALIEEVLSGARRVRI